jgi:hypothetical protein
MRKLRDVCPNCKTLTEPGWKFCLACGEVLIPEVEETPPDPLALTPKQERAYKRGKVKCWQCGVKLSEPALACPSCGADLLHPKEKLRAQASAEPKGVIGNLPMGMLVIFLLAGIVVIGGLGYLMYSNGNDSHASEDGDTSWSFPEIDLGALIGDDSPTNELPDDMPSGAREARVVSVAGDGSILVKVNGEQVDVHLAGIARDFSGQCQGDKGLARIRRILTDNTLVYIYLDGKTSFVPQESVDSQPVYIWAYDPADNDFRFVNEEVIAGGEAELQPTILKGKGPAGDLVSAGKRAIDKERGRYEAGACD